jgi:DNA polymerase III delta' subunit
MEISHQKQRNFLKKKAESHDLSHAYLFCGQEGIGKKEVAIELVQFIHCVAKNKPCNECRPCKLIQSQTYPDLLVVTSAESKSSVKDQVDKQEIDVTQIRAVQQFLSYKAYYGVLKTVIIENADRMNIQAQSCFLKTLEEPKGNTLIILITSRPDTLLQTIGSRCQAVKFFPFEKYQVSNQEQNTLQQLLGVMQGDLAAKFQYAKQVNLEGGNFPNILTVLERYFRQVLLATLGVVKNDTLPVKKYSVEKLQYIISLIAELHQQTLTTNTNAKLALEILLIEV